MSGHKFDGLVLKEEKGSVHETICLIPDCLADSIIVECITVPRYTVQCYYMFMLLLEQ